MLVATAWCFLFGSSFTWRLFKLSFVTAWTVHSTGWDYPLDFDKLHNHGAYTRRLYKDCTAGYFFSRMRSAE